MSEPTCHEAPFVNIAARLSGMAEHQPHAPAVIVHRGHRVTELTFGELEAQSDGAARGLASIGITRGMRTVLMVDPGVDFFALAFGLFKLGAVPVVVDPAMGAAKLAACLAEAAPAAFIGIPKAHAARVLLGWGRSTIGINVTVGAAVGRFPWRAHRYRDLVLAPEPTPFPMAQTTADDIAAILFTSGSTGPPKGVVYRHGNFEAQVRCLQQTFGFRPGERDLATFPLFALFDPALGVTALIPDMDATRPADADPAKLVDTIEKFGACSMFGSPALLDRLSRHTSRHGIVLDTIDRMISAGDAVPARVLERMSAALPAGTQIFTPYGATESLPNTCIGSAEILAETAADTGRGLGVCVGTPVDEVGVAVIGIQDGAIDAWDDSLRLPAGEIGEIVVKGPRVTDEYFGRPDLTRQAKISDPAGGCYHRMGDLGRFDQRGRLWYCGRKSHRVETASGALFTVCCEGVFNVHPDVLRTALVGVGAPGEQTPVLCVELDRRRWPNRRAVVTDLRELGAAHRHTRFIDHILIHPGFPVDARHNSKIFREKLQPWAARRIR